MFDMGKSDSLFAVKSFQSKESNLISRKKLRWSYEVTNFRRDDIITVMGTEVEKAHSVLYGCIVSNDANSNEVTALRSSKQPFIWVVPSY